MYSLAGQLGTIHFFLWNVYRNISACLTNCVAYLVTLHSRALYFPSCNRKLIAFECQGNGPFDDDVKKIEWYFFVWSQPRNTVDDIWPLGRESYCFLLKHRIMNGPSIPRGIQPDLDATAFEHAPNVAKVLKSYLAKMICLWPKGLCILFIRPMPMQADVFSLVDSKFQSLY